MIIETERLILKEMEQIDFDDLYKVLADKENMKFYNRTLDSDFVHYWIDYNIRRREVYGFALMSVVLKETGEVIGDCGVTMQPINKLIRPEIGYHIRLDMHNKGYAKEASCAIRDWAFNNLPFNMIFSYMEKENIASRKTAESYGAKFIEEYTDKDGENLVVYGLKRDDWKSLK